MARDRTVLHLVERLTLGGAGRSLIAAAQHSTDHRRARHRIASLRPADPAAFARARAAGLSQADGPLDEELAATDIVHIHFWNTPDLHDVLRAAMPACRIALTCHVRGDTPPHILTAAVADRADMIIATSGDTMGLTRGKGTLIPASADLARVRNVQPRAHPGFNIVYIGAVDFAKMHPDFVALHVALPLPDLNVIVCGEGPARPALERQIAGAQAGRRFDLRGWVERIGDVLAVGDVFGYPLRAGTFATSELVIHEAMAAGLPCVVMAEGAAAAAIVDGETGFVAVDEAAYRERILQLHDDPQFRRRMGARAAAHARRELGAAVLAPLVDTAYDRLMERPKRLRPALPRLTGSDAFLDSLGDARSVFEASLGADRSAADAADVAIAGAAPALASADSGGVLHYRRAYPADAALRYWSGLVLLTDGRPALAAAEFSAALKSGFDRRRSEAFLEQARDACRTGQPAGKQPHQ